MNQLDEDLMAWEERLERLEKANGGGNGDGSRH